MTKTDKNIYGAAAVRFATRRKNPYFVCPAWVTKLGLARRIES